MPLKSKAFKDDTKLQNCLLYDRDHILPGSRGEHVAKIQRALIQLGEAVINPGEIESELYGVTTSESVRRFKVKRKIVNTRYQDKADNIVGRMTIERLDKEVFDLEHRPDPNPPPTSRLVSLTMAGAPHDHTKCPLSHFPGPDGRVHHLGTPINPLRSGVMINLGGEHETDYLGFKDFTVGKVFAGPRDRPLTSSLRDSSVSDICLRSSPLSAEAEQEIQRIAMPICRLTIATNSFSVAEMVLKASRLGNIVEQHSLIDFTESDFLGLHIIVANVSKRQTQ